MTTTEPRPSTNPRNVVANLRHIANLIESANLGELAAPIDLSVYISPAYGGGDEAQMTAIDQIAAALTGQTPKWDSEQAGKYAHYRTELKHGHAWSLVSSAFVRRPDPAADLRAENERLLAELAEARRDLAAADEISGNLQQHIADIRAEATE